MSRLSGEGSRADVGVALTVLQIGGLGHAGRHDGGIEQHAVFRDFARGQGVVAHAERHALCCEAADQPGELGTFAIHRAIEHEINPGPIADDHDFRRGVCGEVVAHIAQAARAL